MSLRYIENVHWILDKNGVWLSTLEVMNQVFGENIAFVHSLGKKCDSVGWSTLSRDDPQAEEILEKITAFCKEKGWRARGVYIREYADFDTDWYEIDGAGFRDNTIADYSSTPAQDGSIVKICCIKAYRELSVTPKRSGGELYVPERFYKAYCRSGMTGLEFCWAKDTGRYAAQQYYVIYGTEQIPRVAVPWDLKNQDLRKLGPDGGWLPRLGEVFHEWTMISLPYCYRKEDMPAGGIAYAYVSGGEYKVLVHKDVAKQLLQEKALPTEALKPAPVLDVIPSGYVLQETSICPRPTREYMAQSLLDCEALKKKNRPLWQISEKEALKVLRKAKTDRKEDFGKKLTKVKAEALGDTKHASMLPYYSVANGGQLSDEYWLLPLEASETETRDFYQSLVSEELLADKPDGIVICACANGDYVLLLHDDAVIRFSHEDPEACARWPSLAQFIVDAIND